MFIKGVGFEMKIQFPFAYFKLLLKNVFNEIIKGNVIET